jgi:hypothetical protein
MAHLKNPMEFYEQPRSSFCQIGDGIDEEPLREYDFLFLYSNETVDGKPLVAMCSRCEKIRDLVGNWHQVEFGDAVTISHSYCPTCLEIELEKAKKIW